MDLTKAFKPSERIIEILNPLTDEPLGIKVTILSITDERLKKVKRKIQDQKLHLDARGKTFKSEDVEQNTYALLWEAVTSWDWYGDVDYNGVKPEFNQKEFLTVVKDLTWFATQLEEAISDEKAFFQG